MFEQLCGYLFVLFSHKNKTSKYLGGIIHNVIAIVIVLL